MSSDSLVVIPAAIFYLTLVWWIITTVRDGEEEAGTSEDED